MIGRVKRAKCSSSPILHRTSPIPWSPGHSAQASGEQLNPHTGKPPPSPLRQAPMLPVSTRAARVPCAVRVCCHARTPLPLRCSRWQVAIWKWAAARVVADGALRSHGFARLHLLFLLSVFLFFLFFHRWCKHVATVLIVIAFGPWAGPWAVGPLVRWAWTGIFGPMLGLGWARGNRKICRVSFGPARIQPDLRYNQVYLEEAEVVGPQRGRLINHTLYWSFVQVFIHTSKLARNMLIYFRIN